jgi:hypothetical protein
VSVQGGPLGGAGIANGAGKAGDWGMPIGGPSNVNDSHDHVVWTAGDFPSGNIGVTASLRRRRRARVERQIPQLSRDSSTDFSDYGTEEEEDAIYEDGNLSGVRHVYRDDTWSTNFFTYDPKPKDFLGRRDTSRFFAHIPSILTLFELF